MENTGRTAVVRRTEGRCSSWQYGWRSLLLALSILSTGLAGCGQERLKIKSVEFVNLDRGSGFFDRAIRICFDRPVSSHYWHRVLFESRDGFRFEGEGAIRPLATAKDPRCQDKVIYMYINRNSPPDSRALIVEHIKPGNIARLHLWLYARRPDKGARSQPMDEREFVNL